MNTDFLTQTPSVASVLEALVHIRDDVKRFYLSRLSRPAARFPRVDGSSSAWMRQLLRLAIVRLTILGEFSD